MICQILLVFGNSEALGDNLKLIKTSLHLIALVLWFSCSGKRYLSARSFITGS